MLGKIRKKLKGKKGFTMVELIIVIVIILVLSAALVPQLLKYVEQAKRANCQSEAATLLAQAQADYVASLASEQTGMKVTWTTGEEIQGVTVKQVDNLTGSSLNTKEANFTVSTAGDSGYDQEIDKFEYSDTKYYAQWTNSTGWKVVKVGQSLTTEETK